MTNNVSITADRKTSSEGKSSLERPAQELIVFRLQCARTANGLSHYYMYGDITPDETLL